MHRLVLLFYRCVLAVASPCWLLGCAAPGTAPTAKSPPTGSAVRMYGPEGTFMTSANEGRSVPLHKAIEQLVPADYGVRWIDVDVSRRNALVSWTTRQEWPAAMRQAITGAPGLTVDIATGSRLVLIRQVSPSLRPVAPTTPPAASPATPPASAASTGVLEGSPRPASLVAALPAAAHGSTPIVSPAVLRVVMPSPGPATGSENKTLPAVTVSSPLSSVKRWGLSERDRTLKAAIERWAQEAGWRVFWELGVDYPIAATASIGGNFEEAVSMVVRSMDHADVPPKAIFYRGNQVLRMVPRGME